MDTITKTIGMARNSRAATALLASSLAVVLALVPSLSWGDEPAAGEGPAPGKPATQSAPKPPRENVKLPGLVIKFAERCVDLQGAVCLDEGMLELVACTKGTKEHESVVVVEARPMHIHAALLALGAKSGNPAMRKPIDEQETRWVNVPPMGGPVDVSLVFCTREGETAERPISDFVAPSERAPEVQPDDDEDVEFPHTFLFAGSLLRSHGQGPRQYLADHSGHVITISTFGDEVLCLPGIHGQQNGSLLWQVDSAELPKAGTKVILRLRPQVRSAPNARRGAKGRDGRAQ